MAHAQRSGADAASGQSELFGGIGAKPVLNVQEVEEWLPAERLNREYDAIGFFLSGHPLDDYLFSFKRLEADTWASFVQKAKEGRASKNLAATVVSRVERRTKTGNKIGILGLSDPTGHFEAVIFSENLQRFRDLLEPGSAVLLQASAEVQGDEVRVRVHGVKSLDQIATFTAKGLKVSIETPEAIELVAKRLNGSVNGKSERGFPISLVLRAGDEDVEVKLPGKYPVTPQVAGAMKAVPGVLEVEAL
jgi:DNA polymerase-3 subunit alpha